MNKLIVDNELFKKLKKYKKVIYLQPNNEDTKKLEDKSKVIIIDNKTNKKITRKIKKVYRANNVEELKTKLNKKEKYIYSKDIEDNKEVIGIKFKHKRKIIRKMFVGLLILLILFGLYFFISNTIADYKVNKLKSDIENIKEEITYVIVEINPKMMLEIKNGKVTKKGCLNEDCKTIFNDVNITDKSLNETIEILYNKAKEKGIDITNGVSVSSTNKEIKNEVKTLDYVKYKKINIDEEKECLSKVDNNEIREQSSKQEINNELLEVYKKDPDYGKYYTCNIDDSELKCYITSELESILSKETDDLNEFYEVLNHARKFEKILDRFNIKYDSSGIEGLNQRIIDSIYIQDVKYDLFGGTCYAVTTVSSNPEEVSETKQTCYNTFGITIEKNNDFEPYRVIVLPISKFNLVSLSYDNSDLDLLIVDENTHELIITKQ